jgi:hypothetical protein
MEELGRQKIKAIYSVPGGKGEDKFPRKCNTQNHKGLVDDKGQNQGRILGSKRPGWAMGHKTPGPNTVDLVVARESQRETGRYVSLSASLTSGLEKEATEHTQNFL